MSRRGTVLIVSAKATLSNSNATQRESAMQLCTTSDWAPIETREKPLFHHLHGLQYTRTGYGRKIPTRYQVKDGGRWKRVYCCQISNAGTCYFLRGKEWIVVDSL